LYIICKPSVSRFRESAAVTVPEIVRESGGIRNVFTRRHDATVHKHDTGHGIFTTY